MGRVSGEHVRSTRTSHYDTIGVRLCAQRVGHQGGRLAKRTWMRCTSLEQQEKGATQEKEERGEEKNKKQMKSIFGMMENRK